MKRNFNSFNLLQNFPCGIVSPPTEEETEWLFVHPFSSLITHGAHIHLTSQPSIQSSSYPVIHPCSGAEWNGKRIELIFGGLISLA